MTGDEVIKRLHDSDRFVPIDTIEYEGRIIKLPFPVTIDIDPLGNNTYFSETKLDIRRELIFINVIEELIKGMMKGGDE